MAVITIIVPKLTGRELGPIYRYLQTNGVIKISSLRYLKENRPPMIELYIYITSDSMPIAVATDILTRLTEKFFL